MLKNLQNCLELKKKRDKISKNITDFLGDGVQIKENAKSRRKRDEDFFCMLLKSLISLDQRALQMLDNGVNLTLYEDPYNQIIESFIYKHYGEIKAQIIMWWMLASQEDGDGSDLTLKLDEEDDDHVINTPRQLYKVLKKIKV